MLLLILGLTVLTYLVTYAFIIDSVRQKALEEGKNTAQLVAQTKANAVKAVIDEDLTVARIMAEAVEDMTYLPEEERNLRRKSLLDKVLLQYPKYDATWMSWQWEFLDEDWDKDYGRERFNSTINENGEVVSTIRIAELDGTKGSGIYEAIKADPDLDEMLSEPYKFKSSDYGNSDSDSLLAISPTARMEVDGRFAGIIGSDMSVKDFEQIASVHYGSYENAYAVLLSTEGVITSYKDPDQFNKPLEVLGVFGENTGALREKLKRGEPLDYTIHDNTLDAEVYVTSAPISIGRTGQFWTVCTVIPVEEIMAPYNSTFATTILVVFISIIILAGSILYIAYTITQPLSRSTKVLEELAEGRLNADSKLKVKGKDELSKISRSLNRLIDSLQKKTHFAQTIGQGNLDAKIQVDENDVLGIALLEMQNSLKKAIGDIQALVKATESISDNVVSQAEDINNSANRGYETSNNGLSLVNHMSESMSNITSLATETNASFKVLEQRSREISKVVKVITDVTKQTNLLAINAAIQASRAGEAGKGFAVVANEIRRLAESSGDSANEITELVQQMQKDTIESAKMVEQMNESIQKGESASEETSEAFKDISNSITDTVSLSASILSIARQQIEKIKEVSRNTESITVNE